MAFGLPTEVASEIR